MSKVPHECKDNSMRERTHIFGPAHREADEHARSQSGKQKRHVSEQEEIHGSTAARDFFTRMVNIDIYHLNIHFLHIEHL